MVDRSTDPDPAETAEWLEALDSVFRSEGIERGHYLLERLIDQARRSAIRKSIRHPECERLDRAAPGWEL